MRVMGNAFGDESNMDSLFYEMAEKVEEMGDDLPLGLGSTYDDTVSRSIVFESDVEEKEDIIVTGVSMVRLLG